MIFTGKHPSKIPVIGTLFFAGSFLISQFLVAIICLNRQLQTPGDFILLLATIDIAFLIFIFFIALVIRKTNRSPQNESDQFESEELISAYKETLSMLQSTLVPRLKSVNDPCIKTEELEEVEITSKTISESLQNGFEASEDDWKFAIRLIRGLVRIESQCIDLLQQAYSEKALLKNSLASMHAMIDASLPIVEKIILATEEYEADIASQIFKKFEEIWEYSEKLVGDSEKTLEIFSRGQGKKDEGLAYIAEKNEEVSLLFQDFTEVVEKLERNAHSFLEASIKGLEEIRKTISGIEDMAERIKVISINVRIEAARESGRNTGFNVLGQEITAFADQTSVFSNKTVTEIEETIGNLKPLRDELLGNLNLVQEGMESVENKMSPYNRIIDQGFVQMDSVIKNLNEISVNILNKMKQTIGNLQYQDITNQEAMHIIEVLGRMKGYCTRQTKRFLSKDDEDSERDRRILIEVLGTVKSIITTGTEKEILNQFLTEAGLETDDYEDRQALVHSTNLDEKTILF